MDNRRTLVGRPKLSSFAILLIGMSVTFLVALAPVSFSDRTHADINAAMIGTVEMDAGSGDDQARVPTASLHYCGPTICSAPAVLPGKALGEYAFPHAGHRKFVSEAMLGRMISPPSQPPKGAWLI